MRVARRNYLFQHRSACLFPVRVCCRKLSLQDWRWMRLGARFRCLGAAVELTTAIPSPDPLQLLTRLGHMCSLHDRGHQRAAPCRSPTSSGWRGENWQGSSPCVGSGSSLPHFLSTFPSPPPALELPALPPDEKTTFQRPFKQLRCLSRSRPCNEFHIEIRQTDGWTIPAPSGSASLNESS